jgi:hypothetical protein
MRRCLLLLPLVALSVCTAQVTQRSDKPPVSRITFPDTVYVGMPIWMQVDSPVHYPVHYPSSTTPQDFYCNEVELKRDDVLVPAATASPAGGRAGPACGWLGIKAAKGKLPIHLRYPSIEPGSYTVRFTRYQYSISSRGVIGEQSEWTTMLVRRPAPKAVEHWLSGALGQVPADPESLLGDALPSLLAGRDTRVLKLMLEESYNSNELVADYAANALALFDGGQVRAQLIPVLRERGPNSALGYFFASHGDTVKGITADILASSLPRLHSSNPVEVAGAIQTLNVLREPYFALSGSDLSKITEALPAAVNLAISQSNENAAHALANLIGSMRLPDGRLLLWRLIDAGLAGEQSMICVTWYQNASDLPRLKSLLMQYDSADPYGYKHAGVVGQLQSHYGKAALPFLQGLLASSQQTWVRTSAAKGLVELNDRAGWTFFVNVINGNDFYRDEMIRWLRDRFPELRGANDAAILNFLEKRAASAPS